MHDGSFSQLISDPVIKMFLFLALGLEHGNFDLLLVGADSLHIVRPALDRFEIDAVEVLDVTTIASHD